MIGALMERITTPGPDRAQPMNANFGLLPEVAVRRKRDRKERKAEVALAAIRNFAACDAGLWVVGRDTPPHPQWEDTPSPSSRV